MQEIKNDGADYNGGGAVAKVSVNIINYQEVEKGRLHNFWSTYHRLYEINAEVELVVVDGGSNDGSWEKLQQIADVAVQQQPCKGRQRQRALELCTGDYIIDLVDTDQQILPGLPWVVNQYLKLDPPYALNTNGCLISKKGLIKEWPPLCKAPDKLVWFYLANKGLLKHLNVNTVDHVPSTAGKRMCPTLKKREISRDEFFS